MRTRGRGYAGYGLTQEEAKRILKRYRESALDSLEQDILRHVCEMVNPNLSVSLYLAIECGMSFEELGGEYGTHYVKQDFYGYRRKCVAYLNLWERVLELPADVEEVE